MKLRTGMLLGITLLVSAIIGATVVAVSVVVERSERAKLREDLARSRQVFDELLGYRHSVLRSDCRVVANEPRLRATVATRDISRETVVGVVTELRTSLGSDLFLLTDADGILVVDALDPDAAGFDMSAHPAIAGARANGEGSAVWISEGRAFQVQACRIDFGAMSVGVIVVGRAFDDATAQAFHRQTGSTLVVTIDGARAAGSSPEPEPADALAAAVATAEKPDAEVVVAGVRYAVTGGAFPRYEGRRQLSFVLLRSLDEALAPGRQLMWSIFVIAGISLAGALVLAFGLSRHLSRPVDALVRFTRRISRGELTARATPSGVTEVRALANAMNFMVEELDQSRAALAENERLQKEMEIAMRIQTSMLPTTFDVRGLEIAARMLPASEVGGDYYDVLPVRGGCWIGIGDVAGHGLTAGLEMLMVQSVVAALVRENPEAAPASHLVVLNSVVYENIRNRLRQDEHVTLTLLRCIEGKVTFAGAHEEIIVCRAGAEQCERIATPGTWLGAVRDISRVTHDTTIELGVGDLMVLYSDGVTEARDAAGEQFGIERLCRVIEASRSQPVDVLRDAIITAVTAWQLDHEDDISVMVVRRTAV
jgi:sigma-B regulation protein RsbU (phosphoserine phosphatase)